ncbi:MAG: hypothetical protein IPM71_08160 [Bacteroidota bacterium]|nr:MAG: hypothetical protein IPM71_08160 [Bacteroidota bacterium]
MSYTLNVQDNNLKRLEDYSFKSEGYHKISPQVILATHPEIITNLQELEINAAGVPLVGREFPTSSGPIDIIYVTNNSDIVLIETKLLRNPESVRTVVAQVIDYIKALTRINVEQFIEILKKSQYSNASENFDDYFKSSLKKNLQTGNFYVIIVGDHIHPNVLEIVESIQAVPHLSFTISLVELSPKVLNDTTILLQPKVITKTTEVERSVIRLEISHTGQVEIDSQLPEKEGKGSRPILTESEFIQSVGKPEYAKVIQDFWIKWKSLGGDIRLGTVGFSAGIKISGKRKPIQFCYQNKITIVSENYRQSIEISDSSFELYKNHFKGKLPKIYDRNIVGNLVEIPFELLTPAELNLILEGSFILLKEEYNIVSK